jgi:hypothetical protein
MSQPVTVGEQSQSQHRVGGRAGDSTHGWRRSAAMVVCAAIVSSPVFLGATPPASAGLLSGLTCPVTGTVNNLVGVLTAGWDDGATTPPTTMASVDQSIGATQL